MTVFHDMLRGAAPQAGAGRPLPARGAGGAPAARRRAMGVFAAALALGACSGGGETQWYNPADWYEIIAGGGEEPVDPALAARVAAERAGPIPGADEPYPAVGTVPGAAPATTREDERARLRENLAAARGGAAPAAEAPPVPPSAMIAAAGAAPGGQVHVAVIHYLHGSARLVAEDRTVLRRVADSQRARDAAVRIVGHASGTAGDGGGPRETVANFRMALKRARGVADELAQLGVPAERMLVESRSDAEPAFSNATALGEAANRRVDIYFLAPVAPR